MGKAARLRHSVEDAQLVPVHNGGPDAPLLGQANIVQHARLLRHRAALGSARPAETGLGPGKPPLNRASVQDGWVNQAIPQLYRRTLQRPEERRDVNECGSTCLSRLSPYNYKTTIE